MRSGHFIIILAVTVALALTSTAADREYTTAGNPDEPAKFVYGDVTAFSEWVRLNITYPEELKGSGLHGMVLVGFTVKADGSVEDVSSEDETGQTCHYKPPHPLFTAEAVRVVSSSPAWTPALKDGTPTDTRMTVSVRFEPTSKM